MKVNCAAIPTELMESELFGHEKGAFTGATGMRRGKFELADGGTIFLDEVGDLHALRRPSCCASCRRASSTASAASRPSGSRCAWSPPPIATWRHGGREKFREDLYYRLSVVPIRVPALRERPHDIRLLAEYFLDDFCTRNNFKPKVLDECVFPCWRPTTGRAMRGSCAISSSAWPSSPRASG